MSIGSNSYSNHTRFGMIARNEKAKAAKRLQRVKDNPNRLPGELEEAIEWKDRIDKLADKSLNYAKSREKEQKTVNKAIGALVGFGVAHATSGLIDPGTAQAALSGGASYIAGKSVPSYFKEQAKMDGLKAADEKYPKSYFPTLRDERAGRPQYFSKSGDRMTLTEDKQLLASSSSQLRSSIQDYKNSRPTMSDEQARASLTRVVAERKSHERRVYNNHGSN